MSRFQANSSSNDLLSVNNERIQSHFSQPRQESQADETPRQSVAPNAPTPTHGNASDELAPFGMITPISSPNGVSHGLNGQTIQVKMHNEPVVVPVWDRERRELRLGDQVIKRFKWPAGNQERVLNAFEDQGWPMFISDPLDVDPKICPKRRLHDTLKCLNRKQLSKSVKFRGDGTGKGVRLEVNPDADNENNGNQ